MAIDDRDAIERLARDLDAIARGRREPLTHRGAETDPGAGVDPATAETVRRLGARDDAPAPDPGFVDRLEGQLTEAFAATHPVAFGPAARLTTVPNGRAAPPSGRWVPLRIDAGRRRAVLAQLATAALLLLTVGAVFLAFGRGWLPTTPPATVVPAPALAGGVPMFRGGAARTGEQPGPGPAGRPVPIWRYPSAGPLVTAPAVVDGVAYVGGDDRTLTAVDLATGQPLWRFATAGAVGATPAVVDGVVYAGDQANTLYAIDAASGAEIWRYAADYPLYGSAPVVVDGVVYVSGGPAPSSPAIVDGVVYVGGDGSPSIRDKVVLALDAASGQPRWSWDMPNRSGLFALDAADGRQRWYYPTLDYVRSAPAVAADTVFVGSKDGGLSAVDVATGKERWRVQTSGPVYGSPAVVGETVYAGSLDGSLYALDATTGAQRWRAATGAIRKSAAAVAGGVIYVVADGVLLAIDAASGEERWRVPLGTEVDASPVVVGGVVYVASVLPDGTGVLLALGDERGTARDRT